jgi:hypothetical protein
MRGKFHSDETLVKISEVLRDRFFFFQQKLFMYMFMSKFYKYLSFF